RLTIEVPQVLGVTAHLRLRMKAFLPRYAGHRHQPVLDVDQPDAAPLFVLHHHARRAALGMLAQQDHVGPAAVPRQLVLHQDLDLIQADVAELAEQRRNTAFPAQHLRTGRRITELRPELPGQMGTIWFAAACLLSTATDPRSKNTINSDPKIRSDLETIPPATDKFGLLYPLPN